jgi:VWFA-related protein
MFYITLVMFSDQLRKFFTLLTFLGIMVGTAVLAAPAWAQSQGQSTQQQNPNQQQAPPEAGGPTGETGPYAIPKKKDEPPPPPPPTSKPKNVEGMPDYSIHVDVPLVNLDVGVMTKNGQFIPGLKKDNFRVYEDGVQQNITGFNQQEAPITAVLLIEFASTNYNYLYDALNASYAFASTLKKQDWVAVVAYDMKPQILVDFTQDKRAVLGALNMLRIPGFSERNLFDALYDTLDRIDGLDGHKYVILVSTGRDTFSKLNLDQIIKKVKATQNVTIYAVSVGEALRLWLESHGYSGGMQETDWLQAQNQLNTFARLTGGRAYFPRFEGELPEIFNSIGADIRNQYLLSYHPTNTKLDGTYRKLKIDVVGPDGKPLKVRDQKGKEIKYQVVAREGYTAKHQVE